MDRNKKIDEYIFDNVDKPTILDDKNEKIKCFDSLIEILNRQTLELLFNKLLFSGEYYEALTLFEKAREMKKYIEIYYIDDEEYESESDHDTCSICDFRQKALESNIILDRMIPDLLDTRDEYLIEIFLYYKLITYETFGNYIVEFLKNPKNNYVGVIKLIYCNLDIEHKNMNLLEEIIGKNIFDKLREIGLIELCLCIEHDCDEKVFFDEKVIVDLLKGYIIY